MENIAQQMADDFNKIDVERISLRRENKGLWEYVEMFWPMVKDELLKKSLHDQPLHAKLMVLENELRHREYNKQLSGLTPKR